MKINKEVSIEIDINYFLSYKNDVLAPATKEFFELLNEDNLKLHHVFSFNAILAHAVDYIIFAGGENRGTPRGKFISILDRIYALEGGKHINKKFALLDAVNNSFKHVELDKKRYQHLIDEYGDLSFRSLKYDYGKVFFEMPLYKFDYARVVLRPIAKIFNFNLINKDDVDDLIGDNACSAAGYDCYDYDSHEAIDRMIDFCSALCVDCGEGGDSCNCHEYIYRGSSGVFNPDLDPEFNFEDVASNISGTREWRK